MTTKTTGTRTLLIILDSFAEWGRPAARGIIQGAGGRTASVTNRQTDLVVVGGQSCVFDLGKAFIFFYLKFSSDLLYNIMSSVAIHIS